MSVVVTSNAAAFCNVYIQPLVLKDGPALVASPFTAYRWEGSRVASVQWGTWPEFNDAIGWRIELDRPAGECFPVVSPNCAPSNGGDVAWVCQGQGTPTEDRAVWLFQPCPSHGGAVPAEVEIMGGPELFPFSLSVLWLQLPSGARRDPYYNVSV